MKVMVICEGTRPLMMHNGRGSSPVDPYAKATKKISSKRNKTDDDYMEMNRLSFESSLYFDPVLKPYADNSNGNGIGPYLPAQNLFKSIIEGAKITKQGKNVERGVVACDFMLPLIYRGPRNVKELWGNGESAHVDIRPVRVERNKVDRCRAIFPEWTVEAEFIIDPKIIDYEQFVEIVKTAGQMIGVGDYRLLYGRYDAKCEKK